MNKNLLCINCGDEIEPPERATQLKIKTCLRCGNEVAKQVKRTIAPLNKSNYLLITDLTMLTQLNPKRTI